MDKIQEIFTAPWAIADNDYYRLLSLLVPCVAAGNLDAIEKRLNNNKITAYATTPYLANRWELDDDTLPVDSVAVIILEGTLYSWETYRLEKQLRDVFDNPKICGAVLWINGPGGMVAHVDLAAKMIAESSKPIATYVAGTMGSAHSGWEPPPVEPLSLPLCVKSVPSGSCLLTNLLRNILGNRALITGKSIRIVPI